MKTNNTLKKYTDPSFSSLFVLLTFVSCFSCFFFVFFLFFFFWGGGCCFFLFASFFVFVCHLTTALSKILGLGQTSVEL